MYSILYNKWDKTLVINFGSHLKMLGRVARHHNKNVSKIQDHGLHMKSFNGRKLNSISPNSTISEKFDFIKTRNFPLSPQNFSITKNRAQKLDSKAKPQNARLLSSSCSNECKYSLLYTTNKQFIYFFKEYSFFNWL